MARSQVGLVAGGDGGFNAFNDAVEPEEVRSSFLVAADEAHLQCLA
jgi:hypothetical protein